MASPRLRSLQNPRRIPATVTTSSGVPKEQWFAEFPKVSAHCRLLSRLTGQKSNKFVLWSSPPAPSAALEPVLIDPKNRLFPIPYERVCLIRPAAGISCTRKGPMFLQACPRLYEIRSSPVHHIVVSSRTPSAYRCQFLTGRARADFGFQPNGIGVDGACALP